MHFVERTTSEILSRIEELKKSDFFGFESGDLIEYLQFPDAKPFLKDGATAEQWAPAIKSRDCQAIINQIKDYMPFAWDKANNCRGLSAGRSISHMQAWLWMLGEVDAAKSIDDYSLYGKPQLRAICEHFDIDWAGLDDGEWVNSEFSPSVEKYSAPLAWIVRS